MKEILKLVSGILLMLGGVAVIPCAMYFYSELVSVFCYGCPIPSDLDGIAGLVLGMGMMIIAFGGLLMIGGWSLIPDTFKEEKK